jgi:hypothetical protein
MLHQKKDELVFYVKKMQVIEHLFTLAQLLIKSSKDYTREKHKI